MEIRVKTPEEFRAAHVTIEIKDASGAGLSGRLYTAEEVGEAQYSEAEFVAAPLRRKIAELEADIQRRQMASIQLLNQIAELEAQAERDRDSDHDLVMEARKKVTELETALAAERGRADESAIQADKRIEGLETDISRRVENQAETDRQYQYARGNWEREIRELRERLDEQNTRADQNKEWAESAEQTVGNQVQLIAELRDKLAQKPKNEVTDSAELTEAHRVIRQIAGLIARPGTREMLVNGDPDGNELARVLLKIQELTETATQN